MPQRPHYLPIQYQRSVLGDNLGLKKQQGTQHPSATSPRSWVPKGQSAPVSDQQWGQERSDSLGVSGGESVSEMPRESEGHFRLEQNRQAGSRKWNQHTVHCCKRHFLVISPSLLRSELMARVHCGQEQVVSALASYSKLCSPGPGWSDSGQAGK